MTYYVTTGFRKFEKLAKQNDCKIIIEWAWSIGQSSLLVSYV